MPTDDKLIVIPRRGAQDVTSFQAKVAAQRPPEEPTHLLDYWSVVKSRRWTVLAVFMTVLLIVFVATLKQTPEYSASTTLQIDRETPNVLSFKDVYETETLTDDTLQTQFKILESRTLARRVIEELRLDQKPEFQSNEESIIEPYLNSLREFFSGPPNAVPADEPDRLRPVIDRYQRRLTVSPVRLSRLVRVSFESRDPKLAAEIMNAHGKHFIDQNFEFKWDATQQASDFLSQQLVSLKANLERAEEKLQAYGRQNQILFTEQGTNTATEKMRQLEEEYTKALSERFQRESLDRIIRTGKIESLPQLMSNTLVSNLSTRLSELRREESELAVTFGPDYPRRRRLQSQIDEITSAIEKERQRVADTVHAEYLAAVERESLMGRALKTQKDEVNRLNEGIIQYNILKREVDSNKQLYDGLLTRLKEAGVSAGLRASNIRIVDRAEVPRYPIRPRTTMNLVLGVLAGLILGLGMAFFQEYLDSTVKGPEVVERFLRAPLLGTIPRLSAATGKGYGYGRKRPEGLQAHTRFGAELVTHLAPASAMGEAYRSMRTSLLLSAPERSPKSIVVTSAVPSEGKTVTAVNTAISLTQTGARVVLIDGDMRKPRVHHILSTDNAIGLSTFLTGGCSLKSVIRETTIPGLFVIPCSAIPPNPAELILTDRFPKMLEVLGGYFDYVVIDSPPLDHVSDARIIATHTDCAILVIKSQSTSRHLARRALEYLEESRTRIAGIVLNDVDFSRGGYYHYRGYSYGRYAEALEDPKARKSASA